MMKNQKQKNLSLGINGRKFMTKWMTLVLTLLMTSCWPTLTTSLKTYTKEFGEPCNQLEKCNYRHWLKCLNGRCDCTQPDQMLFTASSKFLSFFSSRSLLMERKSCRARVNFSCIKDHFIDDDNNFIPAPPLTRPQEYSISKQTQLCLENSYCHPHGICKCHVNSSLRPDTNTCQKYREFSQPCDRDEDCHPDHFLKCRRAICQCEPTLKYNNELKKCTVPPGERCKLALSIRGKLINNCVRNATCHLGDCKCVRGYEVDYKHKSCSRQYAYFCSETQPCVDNQSREYTCVNSTCLCTDNPHNPTRYDRKVQRCVSLYSRGSSVFFQDSHHGGQPPFVKIILTFLASFLF